MPPEKRVLLAVSDAGKLPGEVRQHLTPEDRQLLQEYLWKITDDYYDPKTYIRPYYTQLEFAEILKKGYPCFRDKQVTTLAKNLGSGTCYVAGGYNNSKKSFPNLFEKNLILRYPFVSDTHAPMKLIIAFPYRGGYNLFDPLLRERGYVAEYPPHEPLHRVFMKKTLEGVNPRTLSVAERKRAKIPNRNGEGTRNFDDLLLLRRNGRAVEKWFVETLTGTEKIGRRALTQFTLNRLLTATAHVREQPNDHILHFVLMKAEARKADELIRKHNRKHEGTEECINTTNIHFYSYKEIETLKKRMGIGKRTQKRV